MRLWSNAEPSLTEQPFPTYKSAMRKLYYFTACYGQIFVDSDGQLVGYIHENDAQWRPYLDFIAEFFKSNVLEVSALSTTSWADVDKYADSIDEFVKKNQALIVEQIEALDSYL